MHAVTLSDQMVEAAAIARHEHCRRRTPLVVSIGWYDLDPEDQACMLAEAHASLTAALALAEAEGAVLCVVPGEAHTVTTPDPPDWLAKTANNPHEAVVSWDLGHGAGHNDCRAATLAGRAWP